ncbi:MarR family winged helix-turn-helix transcriptional regulator [Nocardia sp. NPDC004068]|uniref:MarR family winged helix-turn-helix transcriptional regulator n=1 Tax=Nocardia sp. NPDC004068 TaxID=3364303 RepID=UPI0036A791E4
MVRWLDDDEQTTWSAFIRMRQRLDAAMAAGLARDGLSTPDYEILVALSAAPDDTLRAKDLASEICWDKSRLSKHLSRMESRGLITRTPATTDARGVLVHLTPHGRRLLEEAAPHHVALVRHLFIDALTPEEAKTIRSLAEKVTTTAETTNPLDP